jgi:hypothetical protein
MLPLPFFIYIELAAFIISLLTYNSLKGTAFRPFPFFLLFIVMVELTGTYMAKVLHQQNAWLLNISTTLEFIFYAYIFSQTLRNPAFKKMTLGFIAFFPILVALNMIFIQGFMEFHSYTNALGSVLMVIFCSLFFYELLLNPLEGELHKVPMFWVTTGILFFYLGDLSFDLLYNLLKNDAMGRDLFKSINNNLILILYSCFIIAFLCQRSLVKSLLP